MPIFEFICKECDVTVEEICRMEPVCYCPKCGKEMEKVFPACNFQLKGGGWYKDGYTKKENE